MTLLHFLSYAFIQKAYCAGTCIAVLCAMLGLFLVLRKLSLIGDGLAHVSFGAIALGLFFGFYPFSVAIPVVLIGSYFILRLTERAKIYGDAAIGIVSSIGIASGVILASMSKGFNVDLFSYLFGNILAISTQEVYLSLGLSIVVLLIILLLYNDLLSVTFDEEFAKLTGVKTDRINLVLTFLTAITVVLAIKVVGIMLVSALLILPAVTALQLARGFSFFLDIPAGATIVLINAAFFAMALLYKKTMKV
jgi:zinc transport system permease protein